MPRDNPKAILKRVEQMVAKAMRKRGLAPAAARAEAKKRIKAVRTFSFWDNEKRPSPS